MMDDLESAEFPISLIGNSVIDLPFGLMALKGNEGKSGENWRAGQYVNKTGVYLRLFSRPDVRFRVVAIQDLFQEAAANAGLA